MRWMKCVIVMAVSVLAVHSISIALASETGSSQDLCSDVLVAYPSWLGHPSKLLDTGRNGRALPFPGLLTGDVLQILHRIDNRATEFVVGVILQIGHGDTKVLSTTGRDWRPLFEPFNNWFDARTFS